MINAAKIVARAKARGDEYRAGQLALAQRRNGRLAQARPVTTADDVARKMADDMIVIAAANDEAARDVDLLNHGWEMDALRRYGAAAREIANAARERQLS